jgi:hypothetical protein
MQIAYDCKQACIIFRTSELKCTRCACKFYDGWTDRQDENRRREKIQHKKGQTYLFSGLLKCHLKISYQANKIFGQSLDL